MHTLARRPLAGLLLAAIFLGAAPARADDKPARPGPDPKLYNDVTDRAAAYLKRAQGPDGGWSTDKNPGVTALCLTGLLQTGKATPTDPTAAAALKYIEGLINPRAGHIAGKDPRPQLQNYVTSVNILALVAADRDSYKAVVADAVKFLKALQWDEQEGKGPDSDFYGGAGYDSKSRPDLSNTQMFLDALATAGVSRDDPALKRALTFVSRCQNLKGEHNDQPWAGKINDGSFIYSPAAGGQTKSQDSPSPDGGLPGYGSMTYAGIKSMIYCGASRDDPRVKAAYDWVRKNYSLDKNPGMPDVRGKWGLYYYYHTLAKTLDVLGIDEIEDAQGKKHDWRAELTAVLARQQRPDGSWVNDAHWMEADPNLVTAYALMALSHCQPRK